MNVDIKELITFSARKLLSESISESNAGIFLLNVEVVALLKVGML